MDVVLIIWDKEIKDGEITDEEKIFQTYTITGQDRETVLATVQYILLETFEPLAQNYKEKAALWYQVETTRWRFLERFTEGIDPVVPKREWKQYSWDVYPTKIVEAKRGEA